MGALLFILFVTYYFATGRGEGSPTYAKMSLHRAEEGLKRSPKMQAIP
jgi:hypothetical protein